MFNFSTVGRRLTGIALLSLVVVLALTANVFAQTSKGTVSGIITDPSGAVVANAKVVLTQIETTAVRETVSNATGFYRFDAVNLGTYKMTVTASGFAKTETSGMVVRSNQVSSMDFTLKLGGAETTVEVEASSSAVALQTDDQQRGRSIPSVALANLPISGQNSLNLMLLVPGVVPTNLSGGGSLDSGIGSVNGARPRANAFMIDGVENNDISVAGPGLTMTNNDAIQEVSVQTSNFSAEYGRAGGAVINQITKSGTNSLHGTAAWVYRSEDLNASSFDQRYNYYQGGGQAKGSPLKPAFLEHLPAFTVGGPVYIPGVYNGKNKTFFFVAGQWDRYNSGGLIRTVQVPTQAGIDTLKALAATGKCPNAALYLSAIGNLVATVPAVDATGKPLPPIDLSIPASVYSTTTTCNGTDRAGMTLPFGSAFRTASNLFYGNTIQSRVDHVFSEKHQVSARFMQSPGSYQPLYSLGMSPTFDAGYSSTSYTGGITDTYVLKNNLTNELRLNYFRVGVDWPTLAAAGSLGATMPTIAIGGGFTGLGTSSSYPQGRTFNNYELQDTMSWVHGKHTLRYGMDLNKQIARQIAPMPVRGALTFADSGGGTTGVGKVYAFSNFLDDYSGAGSNVDYKQYGTAMYHPTVLRSSYFIQDSWKVRSDLTLNLGLRYDRFGQPVNNNFPYPVVSLDPTQFPNTARVRQDNNNFGPTVGFAYNPRWGIFSDGKTVIRGGFQIGYDSWFNNLLSNMATGVPNNPSSLPYNATINAATPRGVSGMYNVKFPALVVAPITNPLVDSASQFTADIRNPYTMRTSFGVQRETVWGMIVDVSYVGSLSRKLFVNKELNPFYLDPVTGTKSVLRLNPAEGSRTVRDSAANSNYNSLQIDVRKRTVQTAVGGLSFSSSYTWSHNLDVTSEVFTTSSTGSSYASARYLALTQGLNMDYGNSDLDRRHRWVTSLMLDVKGPKKGILGQVAGGWSIATNIPIMSGTPFTVQNGFDRDGDGSSAADRPDIGNPNAPINTRAQLSSFAKQTCTSGLWNPDTAACTTADQVHWIMSSAVPNANTERRNQLFTSGMINVDMNLLKKVKIREGMSLELRGEIFNLANHMNFNYAPNGLSALGMYLSAGSGQFLPWKTQSDYYTNPGNRTMRLGAKFIF